MMVRQRRSMVGKIGKWRRAVLLMALLAGMSLCSGAAAQQPSASVNPGLPWPATDDLGRSVPVSGEAPAPRPDRFVGIFYFLTLGEGVTGPYDVSHIMGRDPDALKKPEAWHGGQPHFWSEPLLGYYSTQDPWVLRRHAAQLADAGVDTLIFDTTNRVTYPETYMQICKVFEQIRKEGGSTPQICFMANTEAAATAEDLYNTLYKPGLYKDLWFQWQGKPLMICDPAVAPPEIKDFFTLRRAHWPFEMVNTPYAWHWESTYPQPYGYTDDPNKPEMVNVAVAQNLRAEDGKVTNMGRLDARGRGFHDHVADHSHEAIESGRNFAEQWKRAFELDPPFVMVTGWNEWWAQAFPQKDEKEPVVFMDQLNEEYSRDIEPMLHNSSEGGHGDNFYYQLVDGIRRYKGVPALPVASAAKTIALDAGFDAWGGVAPEFTDRVGDTLHRDFRGAGALHFANTTGRNDIMAAKIARDGKQVAFYVRTAKPLSGRTDPAWMWLLIDADQNPKTGLDGYDFVVNRTVEPDGSTWLEKTVGDKAWEKVAPVKITTQGNELMLVIPRSALGLPEGTTALKLDFKWVDNLQVLGDVRDFLLSGDAAPDGRFNYRYTGE